MHCSTSHEQTIATHSAHLDFIECKGIKSLSGWITVIYLFAKGGDLPQLPKGIATCGNLSDFPLCSKISPYNCLATWEDFTQELCN